jgi:hypothetical protein
MNIYEIFLIILNRGRTLALDLPLYTPKVQQQFLAHLS